MTPSSRLLNWYRIHGRNLPWRGTKNPYRILVSEVMLQQTQVDRVKTYFRVWMKTYPNWKALAEASNEQVIRSWAGLGYNRRALMLRDAARYVVEHGVPKSVDEWRCIKGIGPYTAAAVASFTRSERVLPIDTNIRRVLARLFLNIPFPELSDDAEIAEQKDLILPKRGAWWDVPQALFDLATMVCQKTPKCKACPFRSVCPSARGFEDGTTLIPKQMIRKAVESRHRDKPHPDRIYRGRILKQVREADDGMRPEALGFAVDPAYDPIADSAWIDAMIERLVRDQLIERVGATLRLKG